MFDQKHFPQTLKRNVTGVQKFLVKNTLGGITVATFMFPIFPFVLLLSSDEDRAA